MGIKLLVLLLLLGSAIAFFLDNQQPVSLVFFRRIQLTLPLAIWMLLFTVAGFLTNFCLQTLNRLAFAGVDPQVATEKDYSPQFESNEDSREYRTENSWSSSSESDWNRNLEEEEEDWDIEEPPAEPTRVREEYEPIDNDEQEEDFDEDDRELEMETDRSSSQNYSGSLQDRQPSPYSYRYEKNSQQKAANRDRVYDADYRVITPPYRHNIEEQQEEDIDESEEQNPEGWI